MFPIGWWNLSRRMSFKTKPLCRRISSTFKMTQEAQATFRTSGWHAMWATHSQHFPTLWEKARILLFSFPTPYLIEQAFSHVLHIQSKYRNRLNLIASGALRLKLTSIRPSLKKLATNHQAQGFH